MADGYRKASSLLAPPPEHNPQFPRNSAPLHPPGKSALRGRLCRKFMVTMSHDRIRIGPTGRRRGSVSKGKTMAFNPIVDENKCVGCEECVDVCPTEVFEMENEKSVPVNAEECIGCESCVEVCEVDAITVEED
jgi:NAD-dependent dihydropyrimidine dehydrogenase PreA subunit